MDKLGKSLDQLISESAKQEHRQNNNKINNQQRQRHQQNQQDKKQNNLDQRRNIPRQNNGNNNNNRPQSAGKQNHHVRTNVHHNNNNSTNAGDMKVITIERPRVVHASNHAHVPIRQHNNDHHQNVFGRLGGDHKTVVVFDNLRASVTDHDVRELASAMGKISDLLLHVQPNGSKTVRVSFDRAEDARKCVSEYNGKLIPSSSRWCNYFQSSNWGLFLILFVIGVTLDGQAMRVSISSDSTGAAPASVFARIQQPTGSSFHHTTAHTTAGAGTHIAPALSTLNNQFQQNSQQNNNRVGLFGTALPKQKAQNPTNNNNNRRVEVNNNDNNQFKRERKEVNRVVKGRPQQQSRQVEVTGGHLDDQLNNYFAKR